MIFLSTRGKNYKEIKEEISENIAFIDGIEFRADFIYSIDELEKIFNYFCELKNNGLRFILTVRKKEDGGNWEKSENERLKLFKYILDSFNFDYIDCEFENERGFKKSFKNNGELIVSLHNFNGFDDEAKKELNDLSQSCDFIKYAVKISSYKELDDFYKYTKDFYKKYGTKKRAIFICMGKKGFASRVLYKKFSSYLTYVVNCEDVNISIPTPKTFCDIYKSNSVNKHTKLFFVLGTDVMKSGSPKLHNALFDSNGINARLLPFETDNLKEFEEFFKNGMDGDCLGSAVTHPYKEQILDCINENDILSSVVKEIKTSNTIYKNINNGFSFDNTDCYGFKKAFLIGIENKKINNVLILGAGGVVKALIYSLLEELKISHLIIACRNVIKCNKSFENTFIKKYIDKIEIISFNDKRFSEVRADAIIQATPLTNTASEEEFKEWKRICTSVNYSKTFFAMDLCYFRTEGYFLKTAKNNGVKYLQNGYEMLKYQAMRQNELFLKGVEK